jgi:Protein of unknown function (DUF3987)
VAAEPRKQLPVAEPKKGSTVVEEPEIIQAEVQMPEFPRLPGALGRLADAITADIPYEFKALAIIVWVGLMLSGRIQLISDPWLQTRFYALLVGMPGGAKSAAMQEVRRAFQEITNFAVELSEDSGPALVEALLQNPHLMLFADELADQFEKSKVMGNSLFGEFLKLYEHNETANRTKLHETKKGFQGGKKLVTNAHFAILGGVQTKRLEPMFQGTGAGASGLKTRFVGAYNEQVMPRLKTPNDEAALAEAVAELGSIIAEVDIEQGFDAPKVWRLALSEAAQDEIMQWRCFDAEIPTRILDMAKRFAMLVSVCCGREAVDGEMMRLGLAFADYQIAFRDKLFTPDAANYVQAFEHRLIGFFQKNSKATICKAENSIKPDRFPGGYEAFNRAVSALIKATKLVPCGTTKRNMTIFEWRDS